MGLGIPLKPYQPITDNLEPGATARVNHEPCSAGEDTRRRLYLTRPLANPDVIIAYCHNCQEQGYTKAGNWQSYRNELHDDSHIGTQTTKVIESFSKPLGMIGEMRDWPIHAQAWAYKGKLDSVLVPQYGIKYDVSSDRVYIPRFVSLTDSHSHGLQAYQLRNTDPTKNGPKYLTVCSETDNGFTTMCHHPGHCDESHMIVIVEDYLSGIAITEAYKNSTHTHIHTIVNYGTKINLEALHKASQYPRTLVWLDNDSHHVNEQSKVMARTIRLMDSDVQVCIELNNTDPKHYISADIRHEIDAWI